MITSLDELRQVDERTLYFTPYGLGVGVKMREADAATFQQEQMDRITLNSDVAEGTRRSFDRLRKIFVYGVLCYDIFTLVNDHALLVLEQALRDRFIDYHQGTVTFVDPAGTVHPVKVEHYDQIQTIVSTKKTWRLVVGAGQPPLKFNGMLAGLRDWARQVGLLRGQRNRGIERALSNLRNFVAHPTGYQLLAPSDTVRTLSDLAEIINQLWGHPTPGGRLYPAPITREVVVLAWPTDGAHIDIALASGLPDAVDPEDREWQYVIVRALFQPDKRLSDPNLIHFDSRFETTHLPTDLLWGPGTLADATAWWTANKPEADKRDYLDRTFLVRHAGDQLYLPMRPSTAAAFPPDDQTGTWYAIKADFPEDAFHHVRTLLTNGGCSRTGPCRCAAETLGSGNHGEIRPWLINTKPTDADTSDLRTPMAYPRSQTVTTQQS